MKQKQRGRSIRTILCMMVVMLLMACTVVMKEETISSVAAGKSFTYDGKNLSKFKGEKTFVLQKNVSLKEKKAFVKAYRKNTAKFAKVTTVEFSGKLTELDDDMLVFFPNMKRIVLGAKIADVPEEVWTDYLGGVSNKYKQFASFQVKKGNQDYQAKDGVLYNKRMTKLVRIPDQYRKKNLILPDSVTGMVNDAAVPSSSAITTLTIGTSFEGSLKILNTMENLTSINVSGSNTEYASVGGVLYNAAKTKLICWPKANKAESVAFPSTLKSLNVDMLPETTVTLKISKDTTNVYTDDKNRGSCYPLNVLKKLSTVTIEDGNTAFKVEQGILYNDKLTSCYGIPAKTKLTEVSLPEGITTIYDGLFTNHDTITKISLPSTVTRSNSGNSDIFGGEDTLTSLSEYQVASGNASLKAEDGVLYSADGVELYCYPIAKKDTSFTVPDTVKNIYKNAISSKNTSLTKLVFGKNVEALGQGGISLPNLTEYQVVDDNKTFCARDGVLYSKNMDAICGYPKKKNDKSYAVPESVTDMFYYGVFENDYLKNLDLLGNAEIPSWLTKNCPKLETITASGSSRYKSKNGVLYDSNMSTLVCYPPAKDNTSYIIPDSVNRIQNDALCFNPYVKNVTFGKNLRTISYDFIGYGCKSLTTYKVAAANKYYSDAKGLLYDKKKTVLKAYPFGSKAKKLTILKTVKYVNVFDDFLKETKVQKFAVEKGNKWYTVSADKKRLYNKKKGQIVSLKKINYDYYKEYQFSPSEHYDEEDEW